MDNIDLEAIKKKGGNEFEKLNEAVKNYIKNKSLKLTKDDLFKVLFILNKYYGGYKFHPKAEKETMNPRLLYEFLFENKADSFTFKIKDSGITPLLLIKKYWFEIFNLKEKIEKCEFGNMHELSLAEEDDNNIFKTKPERWLASWLYYSGIYTPIKSKENKIKLVVTNEYWKWALCQKLDKIKRSIENSVPNMERALRDKNMKLFLNVLIKIFQLYPEEFDFNQKNKESRFKKAIEMFIKIYLSIISKNAIKVTREVRLAEDNVIDMIIEFKNTYLYMLKFKMTKNENKEKEINQTNDREQLERYVSRIESDDSQYSDYEKYYYLMYIRIDNIGENFVPVLNECTQYSYKTKKFSSE